MLDTSICDKILYTVSESLGIFVVSEFKSAGICSLNMDRKAVGRVTTDKYCTDSDLVRLWAASSCSLYKLEHMDSSDL